MGVNEIRKGKYEKVKKIQATNLKVQDEKKIRIGEFYLPNLKVLVGEKEGSFFVKSNFNLKVGFLTRNKTIFEKRYPTLK